MLSEHHFILILWIWRHAMQCGGHTGSRTHYAGLESQEKIGCWWNLRVFRKKKKLHWLSSPTEEAKCLSCGRITFRGQENVASQKLRERTVRARSDSFLSVFIYFHSVFAHETFVKHLLSASCCWGHSSKNCVREDEVRGLWRLHCFAQMTISDQLLSVDHSIKIII